MKYGVFLHHMAKAGRETQCGMDYVMDQVRNAGIACVELSRDELGDDEAKVRDFARLMRQYELEPSSIYGKYDWTKEENMPQPDDLLLRQAKWMGCKRILLIPGFYTEGADETQRHREQQTMMACTRRMTELAREQGLTATIECYDHALSPIATIAGMAAFLEAAPELMGTLETGNFIFSGDDVLQALQAFRGRIRHVHLKDRLRGSLLEPGQVPPGDPVLSATGEWLYPCAVGAGHMPIAQVLRALEADGYEGVATIEHFGAASYTECILDSARYLTRRRWAE
jgi:sugar phosphate isomerase/epimerase